VTDSSGAAVAKAKVTVLNLNTNVAVPTTTTGAGDYTVPYLKPGVYSVTASAPGFDVETQTGIALQVSQTVTINFSMKVGAVTESIVVNGAQLDHDKSDVGEVVRE